MISVLSSGDDLFHDIFLCIWLEIVGTVFILHIAVGLYQHLWISSHIWSGPSVKKWGNKKKSSMYVLHVCIEDVLKAYKQRSMVD